MIERAGAAITSSLFTRLADDVALGKNSGSEAIERAVAAACNELVNGHEDLRMSLASEMGRSLKKEFRDIFTLAAAL